MKVAGEKIPGVTPAIGMKSREMKRCILEETRPDFFKNLKSSCCSIELPKIFSICF